MAILFPSLNGIVHLFRDRKGTTGIKEESTSPLYGINKEEIYGANFRCKFASGDENIKVKKLNMLKLLGYILAYFKLHIDLSWSVFKFRRNRIFEL